MTDEGARQPLSLMSFNDDILAAILKRLGSAYVIGRAYSLETEPAGSLRIAACVNRRLRRIVHTAVTETCALIDPSALEICISCPRMASTLFQHCDEVRIVPDAASALPKHPTFVSVALNSFTSLKRIHVTGAELSANLAQALACSQILEALVLQHCTFISAPPLCLMRPPPTLQHYSLRDSVISTPATPDENATSADHTHFHPGFFADLHHHCPQLHIFIPPPLRYFNLLDCPPSHIAPSLYHRLGTAPPPSSATSTDATPAPTPPPQGPPPPSPDNSAPPQETFPDFEPPEAFQDWLQSIPAPKMPESYTAHPFQLPRALSYASPTLTALELTLAEDPRRPTVEHVYRTALLSHLPNLRSLTVAFASTNRTMLDTSLQGVSHCTHLTRLHLCNVFCRVGNIRQFTREVLPVLTHLRHLVAANFCTPDSLADLFLGPHREILDAASVLTGLSHLRIVQDSPRCNFDMMPPCIAPVAVLTRLTLLELSPMRWLPPDAATAAAGGADGAVPVDLPGHILQVVEWAHGGAGNGPDEVAAHFAAQVNLSGLKTVLQACPDLRELRLPSLVPVALEHSALRVFMVLPRLERINAARVTIPRRTLTLLCHGSPAPVWRDLWRLHTGRPFRPPASGPQASRPPQDASQAPLDVANGAIGLAKGTSQESVALAGRRDRRHLLKGAAPESAGDGAGAVADGDVEGGASVLGVEAGAEIRCESSGGSLPELVDAAEDGRGDAGVPMNVELLRL